MRRIILIAASSLLIWGCGKKNSEFPNSIDFTVSNNMDEPIQDALVFLNESELHSKAADFNPEAYVIMDGETEVPSQYNITDPQQKGIVFVINVLAPKESRKLKVRYNPEGYNQRKYAKLTQAELSYKVGGAWKDREYIGGEFQNADFMRVPPEHKDHSWFIRYEGPGWESDKVGYRFYLDQRNATDVFGKVITEPMLQQVGLDGFDSYHELQSWGMDVMKVGPSLGVGSIGAIPDTTVTRVEFTDSVTCAIASNGPVYSSIVTNYYGWKTGKDTVDMTSQLSIHAGTRVTAETLTLSKDLDYLCTGLVKDPKAEVITRDPINDAFGYVATYGEQSLNNDNLGIAVLFASSAFNGFTEDKNSHIVKLKSSNGELKYYFLAAWEGEPGGIKSKEEFMTYLSSVARALANPVSVTYP